MQYLKINLWIIVFGCIIFTCSPLTAQDQTYKWRIMGVPQHLFKNGLRIEIDKQTRGTNAWWVFAPQYYIDLSNTNNLNLYNNPAYKQMHGFGMSVYRKVFVSKKSPNQGVYIGGGLGYQNFNLLVDRGRWNEFTKDGLNYFRMEKSDYEVHINKALIDAIVGYQKEITDRLFLDIFIGVGLRYSFYDQPSGSDIRFNENTFDFGYTGTAFLAGLRLGVSL